MKKFLFLLVFTLALVPTFSHAQVGLVFNGETWRKLDRESKIFYLAGYLKGAYRGMLVGLTDIECVSFKEVASVAQKKYRDFVGKGNMQTLYNEIEKVYNTKQNRAIEVDRIIVFALKKIHGGMSAQKQEAWLELLRTMNPQE